MQEKKVEEQAELKRLRDAANAGTFIVEHQYH